jgi:hypothetical protein
MKKKFDINNQKINDKFKEEITNINEEENKDYLNEKEFCVVCRKQIKTNEFDTEPFGKFGFSEKDRFFENCKIITVLDEIKNFKDEKLYSNLNKIYNNKKNESSSRIVTCNHYIHYECYENNYTNKLPEDLRTKKINLLCSLCKYNQNCFIPCFNNLQKNLKDNFLKGFDNFNKLFNLYLNESDDNFIIPDDDKKKFLNINLNYINPYIIRGAKNFIEKHLFLENIENFCVDELDFLLISFNDFFIFYNICEDKKSQIEIMKNLIYSLRILLKSGKLNETILLNLMKILFKYLKTFINGNLEFDDDNNFNVIIEKDKINYYLTNIIFIYLILFDDDDNNQNSFFNHIFYIFFIYNAMLTLINDYYIKNKFEFEQISFQKFFTFDNTIKFFISKNNNSLDKTFDIFIEKINCWLKLFNNNNIFNIDKTKFNNYLELITNDNNILNLSKNNILYNNNFNLSHFINNFINKFIKSKIFNYSNEIKMMNNNLSLMKNKYIFKETFLINVKPTFHYIKLPESMIDFNLEYQYGPCYYCEKNDASSIVCLICGKKLCNSNLCKINKNEKEINSYLEHCVICGGGNIPYVSTEHGDIFYVYNYNYQIKNANLWVYLNYVGDTQNNYKITNDFKLKIDELKKSEKDYINLSFRKK